MEIPTFDQLPNAVSKLYERLIIIEQLLLNKQESAPEQDEIFSVEKAAQFLNLSIPTVYSKVSRKELPVNKQGKRLYFYRSELVEWIKAGRKKTVAELQQEATDHLTDRKKKPSSF
ncbi:helix-turn-helix domain-containing protein [uncultured Mucilaginibacter sp.]|uniref:helix-turn-helix domain-containing protein n=1 Tax=uncultured Mucilaginibacter sp. TaxID=797541 RepID=UPI00262FB03C|nr:helix-turn-helix domain-containing protein [uncultured Mucilaginibacter sp.]